MSLVSLIRKKKRKYFFTTPSHDGNLCILHKFYQWYRCDISETDAYNPQEALEKAERYASKVYGTKSTHFLTNGSTSGILAAVLAACNQGDRILVWDKAHRCHKNAVKLAGAELVEYTLPYNEEWGVYTKLENTGELLKKYSPKALIVTSPSYEGIVSDIPEIARLCKEAGVILIVDEAHGALYPFSSNLPDSAIKYADFTVQSLHKTAGGINPTALLHCNCNLNVKSALNLITTTSPSYPMLASIEANIKYLNSSKGRKKIEELIEEVRKVRETLSNLEFYGDDITKILIKKSGLSGEELSDILYNKYNIEDECANEKSVLLLTGLGTSKEKLRRLRYLIRL